MSLSSNLNMLFKPTLSHQPIATVILVENSEAMSHIWSDLQDQYLNKLVDSLVVASPFVPPTVLVLESFISQDPGSNSSLSRQYSGYHDRLRDLKFSCTPENRISIGIVNDCIDLLDSEKFQGQNFALHLIIVAATTPFDGNGTYSPNEFSPWLTMAQKLANKNVYCHIVASLHQDMSSLKMLFEETLRLQNRIETKPPFPVDPTKIALRLSAAQPVYGGYPDSASSNPYPSQRIILSRRDSYPLDSFHSEFNDASAGPAAPNERDSAPSLVSQLQQVHGLTKKKVYGTKPARQPFFRDERVRDKYRKIPTPLTMPSSVTEEVHSPSAGGKVVPHSRADRMSRVGQASPTDLHSRRQQSWARRGSGLSTPEPDNMSPPASTSTIYDLSPDYVPSDMSSPVTPEEACNLSAAALPGYPMGVVPEEHWSHQGQYHSGYHSLPQQQYFPAHVSDFYTTNGLIIEHADMQLLERRHPSVPSCHSPTSYANYGPTPMLTPPIASAQSYPMNDTSMTGVTPITPKDTNMHSKPSLRSSKKTAPSEEDEERFMFGPDFVAATAALFESEVLPAYPNYPGMRSGLTTTSSNQGTLPYLTPSQTGELYASRVRRPGVQSRQQQQQQQQQTTFSDSAPLANVYSANGLVMSSYSPASYPTSYQPQSSSSLTGWAG